MATRYVDGHDGTTVERPIAVSYPIVSCYVGSAFSAVSQQFFMGGSVQSMNGDGQLNT